MQKQTLEAARGIVEDPRLLRQLVAAYSVILRQPVRVQAIALCIYQMYQQENEETNNSQFLSNLSIYENDSAEMLRVRPFGLLRAPRENEFLLSDSAIITREVTESGILKVGAGFAKPNVHVLLPISPRTCLQIGLHNRTSHTLESREVQHINIDSIQLMHRYVYSREDDPRISELVNRFGGSLRYARDVFINPDVTAAMLLEFFIHQMLGGTDSLKFLHDVLRKPSPST